MLAYYLILVSCATIQVMLGFRGGYQMATYHASLGGSQGPQRRHREQSSGSKKKPAEALLDSSTAAVADSPASVISPPKTASANTYSPSPFWTCARVLTFEFPVSSRLGPSHSKDALRTSVKFMRSIDHRGYDRGVGIQIGSSTSVSVQVEYVTVFDSPQTADSISTTSSPWTLRTRPVPGRRLSDLPSPTRFDSHLLSFNQRIDAQEAMKKHRRGSKAGLFREKGSGRPKGSKNRRKT